MACNPRVLELQGAFLRNTVQRFFSLSCCGFQYSYSQPVSLSAKAYTQEQGNSP
jgi:hypothetical protein